MAKNKIITSQGNVQFINSKGKTINMHPMHCYAVYEDDTVSFLFIYMKEYSGQAFFASQFEDLEVNGETYDNMDDLKDAINYAFAKAGAQARTEIVEELPEDPFTNTIYLLPKEHGEGYDEYIWNEDEGWQLIGDTDIEFERYLKIDDFNPYSAATKDYIDAVSANTEQNASDIQFLSGAVDTEISDREAADSVISGAVDTLSTNLSNEVSRAISAETALGNRIDTVNGRVDAEQIARANAVNALSGAIDTKLAISDFNTYSGAVETALNSKANSADVYTKSEVYTKTEVDEAIAEIDLSDYYTKTETDGLLDDKADLSALTEDERVWGEALNDLNSRINTVSGDVADKADSSAVTAEISAATSGLQPTLSAGTNIDITDNVISVTGISIETSSAVTSGDVRPIQSGALYEELRIEKPYEITLEWEASQSSGYDTTNFPSGATSVTVEIGGYNGTRYTFISNGTEVGYYEFAKNPMTSTIRVTSYDFANSTYTISGNSITINWNSSANVTEIHASNDRILTAKAVGISATPLIDQVSANTATISGKTNESDFSAHTANTTIHVTSAEKATWNGKVDTTDFNTYSGTVETRLTEDEEVTAAGINAVNDKFGGLKLMKISQTDYDNLQVKDNNTLYIISD